MDVTILHHNLKELIMTSDKSEKLDDGIVERVAIASLCANLRKLTLRNMKNLKTLDIFSAELQKLTIIECPELKKIEFTDTVSLRKLKISGLQLS